MFSLVLMAVAALILLVRLVLPLLARLSLGPTRGGRRSAEQRPVQLGG